MEPVALGIKTPDYLERLSTVLGIKAQQQGLEGQAAQVAGQKQTQAQRAGIAEYFKSNPLKHIGEDGTPDVEGMLKDPELRAVAGDQLLDIVTHAAQTKEAQLGNMRTMTALRGDQRAAFGELMNALRGDPEVSADSGDAARQKVTKALIQYGEMYGPESYPVLSAYAKQIKEAPQGHLADELAIIGMQSQAVSNQMAAQQPQYADSGPSLLQTNPNALPTAKKEIKKSLPPGASILTDQKGAQFLFNPQTNSVTPVGKGRGGGSPTAAPSAGTDFDQPGYQGQRADIEANQAEARNVRAVADRAPTNRNIYQRILELSKETGTGPISKFLKETKIGGQLFGDNYQELAKYLEKNAIENMNAMGGPPSDARLSAAVAANGSTGFNPKALQAVTQFNYATNTGMEMYRQGLDKTVGLENPDYLKLPTFKADWAKNFDIDALRLENAVRDKDEKAKAEILRGMPKERATELAEKLRNLEALSKTGKLP